MEEGFPDGRALREIRQEVDNETIARLEPRQPGTGAVYEEVDMNGETEMPRCGKRVMDIRTESPKPVEAQTRCPSCNHIVTVYWEPKSKRKEKDKE